MLRRGFGFGRALHTVIVLDDRRREPLDVFIEREVRDKDWLKRQPKRKRKGKK